MDGPPTHHQTIASTARHSMMIGLKLYPAAVTYARGILDKAGGAQLSTPHSKKGATLLNQSS
jgi:hypothetical protein